LNDEGGADLQVVPTDAQLIHMFSVFSKYIVVCLTGLVVTFLLTPLVRSLALRFGIVDLPNERRPHKRPTARGGGLAVVLGVQAACLVALAFPWHEFQGEFDFHWWRSYTLASLVLVIVGIIDDIRGLTAWSKLAGQVVAATLICLSGTTFGKVFGLGLPPMLDSALVILWIVTLINAFNLIDGLDGLASGLAIISAAGLCGIFILGKTPGDALVLVALIGACLGFLRYNFHPATIFLGDTGSMFIGFTLGVISLQTFTKSTFVLSLTIPMLVLGVPIYDALLAVWRRSVRKLLNGNRAEGTKHRDGLFQPDLEHLHHRLLKAGMSTRRVATVLFGLNSGLVAVGLLITAFHSHAAGIFLIALLAGVNVLMRQLAVIELRDTGKAFLAGLRRPTHATAKALAYPVWDMMCMAGALALVMRLLEPPSENFWHTWFLELPVWVTPAFSLLTISRVYITVWNRARPLDVLMLVFTLQTGLLLSLGIALLIEPSLAIQWCVRAIVISGLSNPAIVGVRVAYRFIEELVLYFRSKSEGGAQKGRIVLYGAGGRCQLFLKERGFNDSRSFDGREIAGLIDDQPSLHAQWVYGYVVLGGAKDLARIIARHRITGIVITATLSSEAQTAVQALALREGVHLTEWCFGERELGSGATQPASRV